MSSENVWRVSCRGDMMTKLKMYNVAWLNCPFLFFDRSFCMCNKVPYFTERKVVTDHSLWHSLREYFQYCQGNKQHF